MSHLADPRLGSWEVLVPAGKDRLPGPFEQDLWVALGHLWRRGGSPEDGRTMFSMAELLDLMRQPRGGKTYRMVREGIVRLGSLTFVGYGPDDADIFGSTPVPDALWHLIDRADLKDPKRLVVHLGSYVCEAMDTRGRNLDASLYFALDSAVARRLYRYLDVRRYRPAKLYTLTIPLAELAAELPLRPAEPRLQKRNLADAHEELVAAGYLGAVTYEQVRRGEWLVTYTFPEIAADAPPVLTAATPAAAADDRVRRRVQELLELLRDHASVPFFVQVARDLPDPVYEHLVGGVREMRREGMALDRLRKVFTASARARLQHAGARAVS